MCSRKVADSAHQAAPSSRISVAQASAWPPRYDRFDDARSKITRRRSAGRCFFAPSSCVPPIPPNGPEDGCEQNVILCVTNIHVTNIDDSNTCENQTRSYPKLEAILSRGMSKAASESGLLNFGTLGKMREARS